MYSVFDKTLKDDNSYVKYFGDDDKPMVNTIQGPSEEEQPSACNCLIK